MPNSTIEPDREAFRKHYEDPDSAWGNTSGPGSDAFYTTDYRGFLSKFIRLNGVRSVVDIGCGDWQFSRFIDFADARYLGLDLVESVIERNAARYAGHGIEFRVMPADMTHVPGGDLLIMKDVLQHLSNDLVFAFFRTVFPKFRWCLLTNSYRKLDTPANVDIPNGSFRCLDLTAEPFEFRGTYVMEFGSSVWERVRTLLLAGQPAAR